MQPPKRRERQSRVPECAGMTSDHPTSPTLPLSLPLRRPRKLGRTLRPPATRCSPSALTRRRSPLHVLFVPLRAQLLLQVVLVFLDQSRIVRAAVDVGRDV